MPMSPISVDKGEVMRKQAADNAAGLKKFEASATKEWGEFKTSENQKWEDFVKTSESDTANYYSNMKKLGDALTGQGVSNEQLKGGLFTLGFSNAMQGIPASHIRAGLSGVAQQLLSPDNKEQLGQVADQMKHVYDKPAVPTKDEFEKKVKEELDSIKADLKSQGATDEQADETIKNEVHVPTYEQAQKKAEARAKKVDAMKDQVEASDKALDSSGVSPDEKAGALALTGYMSGHDAYEMAQQQQAGLMEMLKQLQAAQGGGQN